jgi:hypothetical protein
MIHQINNSEDVALFAKQLVIDESLNFHPDDDFNDYVKDNGEPCYTTLEAEFRNLLMEQCFEVCEREGKDIYCLMMDVFLVETGMVKYIPLSTSPLQDEVAAIPARHLEGARLLSYREIKDRHDSGSNL